MKPISTLESSLPQMAIAKRSFHFLSNVIWNMWPFSSNAHSLTEIHVIYKQCYLPMVSYPLPATTMLPNQLYKLQSLETTTFLNKMGYPQTCPRAIMYAASNQGGLGFWHLGHEQGVQKCMQVIKHIWANATIGMVYSITLQHYQLMAGLSRPILEDTRPILWSFRWWIDQLHQFFHATKGTINCGFHTLTKCMTIVSWMTCIICKF